MAHTYCCCLHYSCVHLQGWAYPTALAVCDILVFFFFSVIQVMWEKTCLSREFTAVQWSPCHAVDTQEGRVWLPTGRAQIQVTLACNFTFSVWAILWYLGERKIGLDLDYLYSKCRLHHWPILLVCIFLRILSPSSSSQGICSLPPIGLLLCLPSASSFCYVTSDIDLYLHALKIYGLRFLQFL